ncbi:LptF/LptG family permease [Candidatus Pelagibacter bacterium]|nr:LptF/LptG family permease [Candidatus Pelagibacter bacterium]
MLYFNKNLIFNNFFINITKSFIFLLLSFSLIVWIIQAVNYLDFITDDGHDLVVYLNYTLLNLPKIIVRLTPLIFLISIYYVITNYEDNNELNIFWLFGIKKIIFLKKIIVFSFYLTLAIIFLNNALIPYFQKTARTFIQESNIDFFPSLIKEKKFIDTVKGLTIFIEKNNSNYYENIFLKEDKVNSQRVIIAKNGELINTNYEKRINLYDGKIIDIADKNILEFSFKSTSIDLSKYLTKSILDFKIQERSTIELFNCYWNFFILKNVEEYFDVNNCNRPAIGEIESEFYKRIIKPFYVMIITLICGFLLLISKENILIKRYRFLIFFSGFIIIIISELFNSVSSNGSLMFLFMGIFPIIIFISIYLLYCALLRIKKL